MTESVKLRSFDWDKDIETACEFHVDHVELNFPDSMYKKDLFTEGLKKKYDKKADEIWMAEDDSNNPVGILWLDIIYDPFKEKNYGNIHYIHLVPEVRGKGFGRQLMEFAEDYFKKNDVHEFRLGTHAGNASNNAFYEKMGYHQKRVMYEKKVDG